MSRVALFIDPGSFGAAVGRRVGERLRVMAGHADRTLRALALIAALCLCGLSAPASAQVANAGFVDQAVPAVMSAGATYSVTVRMLNTGSSVWRVGELHRLGSQNPRDNWNWGRGRADMTSDVAPGAVATFNFDVVAPATPGTYDFQWQMLQEGVQWFGAATTNLAILVRAPLERDAEIVSQSVPSSMTVGLTYPVNIKVRNTGTATWTVAGSYRLGAQNPHDNGIWSRSRVDLGADIAPGQVASFDFDVIAPASAGSYNFQWRMLQEGLVWFGALSPNVAVQVADPPASGMLGVKTRYDALGRVISVAQDSEIGVLTSTTGYGAGLTVVTTNARGHQTVSAFQAFSEPRYDLPVAIHSPQDSHTEISRDLFGKPKMLRRRNGGGSVSLERYLVYDQHQRLCKTIEPETAATVTDYDAAGNVAWTASGLDFSSRTDCNREQAHGSGHRVDRSYDDRNRLKTLSFPDGRGNQVWAYTPDGLVREVTTSNDGPGLGNVVNTYGYNKRRMPAAEWLSEPGSYAWMSSYGYDANGNRNRYTGPDGLQVSYANNALGQPLGVSSQWGVHASAITYYPNGAINRFVYGNGIVHVTQQNARQLPSRSTDSGVVDLATGYDQNANVTEIIDHGRGTTYSRWMSYDNLDRLTAAGSCSFGGDCWHRFDYDALDNLARWSLGGVKNHYYVYDAKNHLTNLRVGEGGPSVSGLGYDAQGNLNNKDGQAFDFDMGNRLRGAAGKEFYRYDAHGRRVSQTGRPDGTYVYSVYDQAGQLLLRSEHHRDEAVNDLHREVDTAHIYLSDSLLASIEWNRALGSGVVKYHHTDGLGSPLVETNAAGAVLGTRTDWAPYGVAIGKPQYDGIGYAKHVMDAATALTYMQQRYYDAAIGRFLSVDPVAVDPYRATNFARYAYANNNPFRFVDPDGRQSRDLENEYRLSGARSPSGPGPNLIEWGMVEFLCGFCDLNYRAPNGSGQMQSVFTPMETAGATAVVQGVKFALSLIPKPLPPPGPLPQFLYRSGGANPGNLTPRTSDGGMLSTRSSASNPFPLKEGQQPVLPSSKGYVVIETDKLPAGSVVVDGAPYGRMPPGHVSIGPNVPSDVIKKAIYKVENYKVEKP
ncbi:RHS repeat domain-containing protein [Lysobacter enzymogenes]|uniref:RHS repeat domain-containing protein n=1 Tax=Lysobacter enzymogenes TaxID=69 RepID=UPI001A9784F2|nr:RHS repeat-associated core domain-containing protein [Lysobacter enzymogenes]QQP98573.1 hypothetical protein JHW38_11585 [Lysobacter enzymogenes]